MTLGVTRQRVPTLLLAVLLACGQSSDRSADASQGVASRPDSAGWRFVRLSAAGLELRYPVNRVREVRDQTTPACTLPTPVFAAFPDTTQDDVLIVTTGSQDFDQVARAAGFEREQHTPNVVCSGDGCALERWTVQEDGPLFSLDYAVAATVNGWRSLLGTTTFAMYIDDSISNTRPRASDEPDVAALPDDVYQTRLVASRPGTLGCAIVLAWRGPRVRETRAGDPAPTWDSTALHHMLNGTTVQ